MKSLESVRVQAEDRDGLTRFQQEVLAELRAIRQAVEQLHIDVELPGHRPEQVLIDAQLKSRTDTGLPGCDDKSDTALLGRLLPAAGGKFGSAPFKTKELLSDPAIRSLTPLTASAIGSLFSFAARSGVVIAGLKIFRIGAEGHASLWMLKGI